LTRQQQTFLCALVLLFLSGLAVKTWRAARPLPDVPPPANAVP
jgi:hypothetical protein